MGQGWNYRLVVSDGFSASLNSFDRSLNKAAQATRSIGAEMADADRKTQAAMARMEANGAKLAAGLGVAMVAVLPLAAASFLPLESALARLGTVMQVETGTIDQALGESLDAARKWSTGHVQSTVEVLNAQKELATAGLTAIESLEGVSRAMTLATATGESATQSARLLASIYNSLGSVGDLGLLPLAKRFESIQDTLALGIQRYQAPLSAFREGLAFTAAQAATLGLSLNEVVTSLGALNSAGIRGSNAGTGFSNTLIRMRQAVEKLGLQTENFTDPGTGGLTSMADYLDEVAASLDRRGLTSLEKVMEVQRAMGQRAARTTLVLLSQRKALRRSTEEFRNLSGAAEQMAARIEDTTASKLKIATNQIMAFGQSLGEGLTPMLASTAEAIAPVTEHYAGLATKSPLLLAATIGLTGAVMVGSAAWLTYRSAMHVTGQSAVSLNTALRSVGKGLAMTGLLGLATFAVGSIIMAFDSATDTTAGWAASLNDPSFGQAEKRFTDLANAASAAAKEQKRAQEGAGFGGGFLKKAGFAETQIEDLKSGAPVIGTMLGNLSEVYTKHLSALTGEGESLPAALAERAKGLETAGVAPTHIITGLSDALQILDENALGAGDATSSLIQEIGLMEQASRTGLRAFNEVADSWNDNAFQRMITPDDFHRVESFSEALKQLRVNPAASANAFEFSVDPDDVVDAFASLGTTSEQDKTFQISIKGAHAFFDLVNSEPFQSIYGDDAQMQKVIAPILGGDWMGDVIVSGERTAAGFWSAVGSFTGREAQVTMAEATVGVFEGMQRLIGSRMDFKSALGDAMEASAQFGQAKEASVQITNSLSSFAKLEEIQKKAGFSSGFLGSQAAHAAKAIEAQSARVAALTKGVAAFDAMSKAAKGLGLEGPKTIALSGAAEDARRSLDTEAAILAVYEQQRASVEARAAAMKRLGGSATVDQLRATDIATALSETLGAGTFENFKSKLYEGMSNTLRDSIVNGAREGLAGAMGVKFKMMLSGEALQNAVKDVFTKSGGDPRKISEGLGAIREKWNAMFADPEAMENLRQIHGLLNDFYNAADQASAKWTGNEATRLNRLKNQTQDLVSGASAAITTMAELQTSLVGAGSAERLFGSQVEGLLRTGGGFGFDERLSAAVRGLEIARQEGLERTQSFGVLKAIVLEEHKRLELAKQINGIGGSPTDAAGTTTAAEATKSIVADLASVKADAYADIASELERGVEAAEAIREALAVVTGGQLIPSQISVSGGGSGETTIVRKGVVVNVAGGKAANQQAMDELERRMRADLDQELEQIRAALSGK